MSYVVIMVQPAASRYVMGDSDTSGLADTLARAHTFPNADAAHAVRARLSQIYPQADVLIVPLEQALSLQAASEFILYEAAQKRYFVSCAVSGDGKTITATWSSAAHEAQPMTQLEARRMLDRIGLPSVEVQRLGRHDPAPTSAPSARAIPAPAKLRYMLVDRGAHNLEEFERAVNESLDEGWQPLGAPAFVTLDGGDVRAVQALVRPRVGG